MDWTFSFFFFTGFNWNHRSLFQRRDLPLVRRSFTDSPSSLVFNSCFTTRNWSWTLFSFLHCVTQVDKLDIVDTNKIVYGLFQPSYRPKGVISPVVHGAWLASIESTNSVSSVVHGMVLRNPCAPEKMRKPGWDETMDHKAYTYLARRG